MTEAKKPDLQTADLNDLSEFATAFIENVQASHLSPDAFEFYAHKVQSSVFVDHEDFKLRFIAGYQALLKELSS